MKVKVIMLQSTGNNKHKDFTYILPRGHAEYLIRVGQAQYYTAERANQIESRKEEIEKNKSHEMEVEQNLANTMNGKILKFIRPLTESGQFYGSINAQIISTEINNTILPDGMKPLLNSQIQLTKVIKEPGLHNVKINLNHNIKFSVQIIAHMSELEVQKLEQVYLASLESKII